MSIGCIVSRFTRVMIVGVFAPPYQHQMELEII